MSAAPEYEPDWPAGPAPDLAALLAAAGTAVADLTGRADLDQLADRDAAAVMGTLTTLVGRLDGLRVRLAREVRDRAICGLRGTRTLTDWLRADARLADDARKIGRLAAMGPDLPKVTALLGAGTISLAQAATACWQIAQLPRVPVPPDTTEPPGQADPASGDARPGPDAGNGDAQTGPQDADTDDAVDGDAQTGPRDADTDGGRDDNARTGPRDADGEPGSGTEPSQDCGAGAPGAGQGAGWRGAGDPGGDAWAGLWRAGDVHAAADELFAAFLPGLDANQLRQLGAHLREAADGGEHAVDDSDDYARRGLRISRSLGGAGEISGRLHAEAAEQVIAAFEELGAKTGPDDKRTKAQRWADVLARLAATSPDLRARPAAPANPATTAPPGPHDQHMPADPGDLHPPAAPGDEDYDQPDDTRPGDEPDAGPGDDQPYEADSPSGHDHHGGRHAQDPGGDRADGQHDNGARPGSPADAVPAAYRRPRLIVTVPLPTLLGQPLAPGATLGSGTPLTAEAARRLACDAEIIRLITGPAGPPDGGHDRDATARLTQLTAAAIAQLPPPLATPSAVLDIGRKSPGWTPRQRDALYAQYGGHCGFGRCDGPIDVIHHIIHWLHGGKTRIKNGFPCCKYHHWLLHEGGWRITKHRNGQITIHPPPPGWKPGTIYRHGKPITE